MERSCPVSSLSDFDVLQFLTLYTSVHADAVECSTQELRDSVTRLSQEDALLREHEVELGRLLTEQRRLEELHALVQHARQQRRSHHGTENSGLLRGDLGHDLGASHVVAAPRTFQQDLALWSRAMTVEGTTTTTPRTSGLKRAVGGVTCDDAGRPAAQGRSTAPREGEDTIGERVAELNAAIEVMQSRLETLDRGSTRRRLQALENAKVRAGRVSPEAVCEAEVGAFRFRPDVEALWANSPTLSPEEVAGVTMRAAGRATGRYREAMRLLEHSLEAAHQQQQQQQQFRMGGKEKLQEEDTENNHNEGQASRVKRHNRERATRVEEEDLGQRLTAKWRTCYAYAALLGDERSMEANMIESLQDISAHIGALARGNDDEPRQQRHSPPAVPSPSIPCATSRSGGGGRPAGVPVRRSERSYSAHARASSAVSVSATVPVLTPSSLTAFVSGVDYACLPHTWPGWRELCATPDEYLLPPTRTLHAHRLSFTDVPEHQALMRIRIDLQRALLRHVVSGLTPLNERRDPSQEEDGGKDAFIANARVGLPRGGKDPYAWRTLLRQE